MQAVMDAVLECHMIRQEAVVDHGHVNPDRFGRCGAAGHCKNYQRAASKRISNHVVWSLKSPVRKSI
jgi:hypothetical protein